MEAKKKEIRYVGVKENLLFALANGGQCFSYNMFTGSYLSLFFVRVFGIPTGAVATMLLVLGIWDTVNDPIMGGIVDKTHTRYGKLRPWLLIVPIPLAISTILFWSGPLLLQNTREMTIKIVYMYLSYLLWEFFYVWLQMHCSEVEKEWFFMHSYLYSGACRIISVKQSRKHFRDL